MEIDKDNLSRLPCGMEVGLREQTISLIYNYNNYIKKDKEEELP